MAVPALLAQGLLKHSEKFFQLPKGYYGMDSIFLIMSLITLSRVKSIEQLRYTSPGEWGKIIGLDRIPEVKTLREKINFLSNKGSPEEWNAELSKDWMNDRPDSQLGFYIDGHVRVYHGSQTQLPRHFVSREKLCLRATVDYWVNAMDGQPFFLVNKAIDPGMIKVLDEDIVPRLITDVPNQPSDLDLEINPYLHKFTLVFDREGYSPDFFLRMKLKKIACISYHKFPDDPWSIEEFSDQKITLISGEETTVSLAERGIFLSNKLWVREIRKRSESGHQTSILSTDFMSNFTKVAVAMFARWSQENFFRYMRQEFNLDRLVDYNTESISDTTKVVNPAYREVSSAISKRNTILNRRLAKFSQYALNQDIDPEKIEAYQKNKSTLYEEIELLKFELQKLKTDKKNIDKHIEFGKLPDDKKFDKLSTKSKHFCDTIKMIAYRAETSMANILKDIMPRGNEDSRSVLRGIFNSSADITPKDGFLIVKIHSQANQASNNFTQYLCTQLNETNEYFPGTNLMLKYEVVSKSIL